jgi:hypothetical protein
MRVCVGERPRPELSRNSSGPRITSHPVICDKEAWHMAWIVPIPPSRQHPRERYQVCFQDGKRHAQGYLPHQAPGARREAGDRAWRPPTSARAGRPRLAEGTHATRRVRDHRSAPEANRPACRRPVADSQRLVVQADRRQVATGRSEATSEPRGAITSVGTRSRYRAHGRIPGMAVTAGGEGPIRLRPRRRSRFPRRAGRRRAGPTG